MFNTTSAYIYLANALWRVTLLVAHQCVVRHSLKCVGVTKMHHTSNEIHILRHVLRPIVRSTVSFFIKQISSFLTQNLFHPENWNWSSQFLISSHSLSIFRYAIREVRYLFMYLLIYLFAYLFTFNLLNEPPWCFQSFQALEKIIIYDSFKEDSGGSVSCPARQYNPKITCSQRSKLRQIQIV
jgi:hypothetical protein